MRHHGPRGFLVTLPLVILTVALGSAAAAPTVGPTATVPPTISGTLRQGQKLIATLGTWSGSGTLAYAAKWYRCDPAGARCLPIRGATGAGYTTVVADVDRTLGLTVKITDTTGTSVSYSSVAGPIAATAATLAATAQPRIAGTAQRGQTITVDTGSWSTPPPAVATRWLRCNVNGRACVPIAGAAAAAYQPVAEDIGRVLVAAVEATVGNAKQSVLSIGTAPVKEAGDGLPAGATPLPGGGTSIPIDSVGLPQRLTVAAVAFDPPAVRSRSPFTLKVTVKDSRGFFVRGALVLVEAIPYGRVSKATEQPTGNDGTVTLTFTPTSRLTLAKGAILVFFVRARKAGEAALGGVSASRLVQLHLGAPAP